MLKRPAYIRLNSMNINYTSNNSTCSSYLQNKEQILDEMFKIIEARSDNTGKQANNIETFQKIICIHHFEMMRAHKSCGTGSISVNTIRSGGKYIKDCMRLTYKNDGFVSPKDVELYLIPHTIAPTIKDYFYLRSYITKIEALLELSAIGGKRTRALHPTNCTFRHLRRIEENNYVVFHYVEEQIKKIYLNPEMKCRIEEIKKSKN